MIFSRETTLKFCLLPSEKGSTPEGTRNLSSLVLLPSEKGSTLEGKRNLVNFVLSPFRKGIYSKRKEFTPSGSKFFPVRLESFSERN